MTRSAGSGAPSPVVHLLPADANRGAQRGARLLVDALSSIDQPHLALTLFAAPAGLLLPERSLGLADPRGRGLGFSWKAIRRLRRTLRSMRPAALVLHGGEVLPYAALAAPRGTPIVYHRIGTSGALLSERSQRRRLYAACARRVTATVAISAETATETAALGLAAAERVIIPNGRDPELYRPGPQLADGDRRDGTQAPVRLLFVGHLNAGKGADLFADVVERLRHDGLDVVGVMAGEGPLADELSTRTGSPLQMLGHVDDVAAVMAQADVFVFPSVDREGLPGVVVEAAMCGLAIVATDRPGVGVLIEDGVSGALVDADDADGLAAALRALVVDPELRRRLGTAARDRAIERCSLGAVVRQWESVVRRAVGAGPDGSIS